MSLMPTSGPGWGDLVSVIAGLGKTGAGIANAFQKQPYPPGFQEAMQAQHNANTYLAASADPSSPYFRNIAEGEEQRMRGDLVSSIQEIIRANLARQGRGAFVQPERRDETVWRALIQGFRDAGMRSRELARTRLLQMSGASSAMADNFRGPMAIGAEINRMNRNARLAGTAGSFDALGAFGSMLKPGTKEHGTASVPNSWSGDYEKDRYYRPWAV